ncbi:hypothetical protein GCM10023189_06760 [Nibrella saemangeumensis]|uniref:histidine kinase n=2 Tax=Nibrella saemangeumensis TaxID=1084526 RepID=A0ABP8MEH0_9BACT
MPLDSALQSQLTNFRALIEHSSDVIIISDKDGIERYVSPSVVRVLGYQPEELLSRSQYLLHHPDDRDRVRKTFFDFVTSCCATPIVFSFRFLHKNGTWRWIEATASNQLENPLIQGIILNFRDISDRKELEAQIERNAERFRAMIANIADFIQIFDKNGKLLFTSKPTIYPVEVINQSDELLWWVHPEDRPRVTEAFHKIVSGEIPEVKAEYRTIDENGVMRYVETYASNQFDNEAVGGLLTNIRDITERKEFEEVLRQAKEKAETDAREIERSNLEIRLKNRELKKLNDEKNELMQMVTHDLKNPLYNLQHEARSILANPDEAVQHTAQVLRCADKMLSLITNFLSIHSIESGRILMHFEPVDLLEQINRVVQLYEEALRQKRLSVTINWPGGPTAIRTDENAVSQVLDNLVSNAIKYSPVGASVSIDVTRAEESLIIRVQDEGTGIPLDEADKLFRKFSRLSTRPTAGESSNGLGLAIAKKLVHLLQGDIWYENHAGKGATFAFELPVNPSA